LIVYLGGTMILIVYIYIYIRAPAYSWSRSSLGTYSWSHLQLESVQLGHVWSDFGRCMPTALERSLPE
jgi:hypothetical protein